MKQLYAALVVYTVLSTMAIVVCWSVVAGVFETWSRNTKDFMKWLIWR